MIDSNQVKPLKKYAEWCAQYIMPRRKWLSTLAIGFLSGRIVNAASLTGKPHLEAFTQIFADPFSSEKILNVLSWASVTVLVLLVSVGWFVDYQKRKSYALGYLMKLAKSNMNQELESFRNSAFVWKSMLTLQLSPDLQNGWLVSQLNLAFSGKNFVLPEPYKEGYHEYLNSNANRFKQDGVKFMLANLSSASTDAPVLDDLIVYKTKFSVIRYYQENIINLWSRREEYYKNAVESGEILFPNSLCMHAVVTTSDYKILATKRSKLLEYYPGAWSVSLEEQLSADDFKPDGKNVVEKWAKRLLWEELGVGEGFYHVDNFSVFSIFIESDLVNCSIAVILRLELTSDKLRKIIETFPRPDYEFSDVKFYTYPEIINEIRSSTGNYHPSASYRMLLAAANRYGLARLAEKLSVDI